MLIVIQFCVPTMTTANITHTKTTKLMQMPAQIEEFFSRESQARSYFFVEEWELHVSFYFESFDLSNIYIK